MARRFYEPLVALKEMDVTPSASSKVAPKGKMHRPLLLCCSLLKSSKKLLLELARKERKVYKKNQLTLLRRIVFTLLMSGMLSFVMTLWVTFINLGLVDDFLMRWKWAFLTAWPAAAVIAFVVSPIAQKITLKLFTDRC